jgi:hypothetical protein
MRSKWPAAALDVQNRGREGWPKEGDNPDKRTRPIGERGGGKVELGRRANWAVGRELGRARRAGLVGKEEGGWAGGLKGRGGVKGLGSFLFSIFSNPFQTLNSFQSLNTSNPLQVFKLF